jgi:hypothetical protein
LGKGVGKGGWAREQMRVVGVDVGGQALSGWVRGVG